MIHLFETGFRFLFMEGIHTSSIREVAKLAGVSPATVSRVINGTAKVDSEKQDRVQKAIADTGFIPNEVARSRYKKSARLLGLIIPSLQSPFFTQLSAEIGAAAKAAGYHAFLLATGRDPEQVKNGLQLMASMNVDGVVLTICSEEIENFLKNYRLPVAALDCMDTARNVTASIYCDYYNGGRMAMEHLIQCGCRKVICIKGDQSIFSARMRYEGYRDVCREQGIPEHSLLCDYYFHSGLQMTQKLLQLYPDADGILACNDLVAVSTYKVLHKYNIQVPQQIQLIGFDDINLTELMSPELTTIHQPIPHMAELAVSSLIHPDRLKENTVVLPVSLKIRETTRLV